MSKTFKKPSIVALRWLFSGYSVELTIVNYLHPVHVSCTWRSSHHIWAWIIPPFTHSHPSIPWQNMLCIKHLCIVLLSCNVVSCCLCQFCILSVWSNNEARIFRKGANPKGGHQPIIPPTCLQIAWKWRQFDKERWGTRVRNLSM